MNQTLRRRCIAGAGVLLVVGVLWWALTSRTEDTTPGSSLQPVSPTEQGAVTDVQQAVEESVVGYPSSSVPVSEISVPNREQGAPTSPAAPVVRDTPEATPPVAYAYPRKRATATIFWVGEGESGENGYIHNRASAWDEDWMQSYGGEDDPAHRCGYLPCAFTPKQNPFYIALPYLERTEDDRMKSSATRIPWFTKEAYEAGTLLRGRWVEVTHGGAVCYGQWEDVGPFEMDDYAYVFGDAQVPKNRVDTRAGIDLSPALGTCLNLTGAGTVAWRFVDAEAVPPGPWGLIGQ